MIEAKKKEQVEESSSDFDSAWKDVIEELFEPFLQFFFPEIHRDIDFSKGYEFLSNELRQIIPDSNVGRRYADELVKVHLKDGSVKCICIFIHIEVQGQKETGFPERVYVYNYRIFDKYREEGIEVISLVILTDEDTNWRPNVYCINRWGFKLLMEIPIVKIIDYRLNEDKRRELESSDNPMALVVKAQLKSSEVKKADNEKKSSIKWELIYQCYRKGYTKEQIETLLKFIDWLIKLPDEYQGKLNYEILKLEEDYKMPYVTSWERMAKKEGVKQGKLETAKELVKNGVDIDIIVKATGFTREEIEKLAVDVH
jgi:hypothetical protein